jgi:phenylacetaldehyde dehydrogenase
LKPSEVTPLNALYLGKLIKEAGFPSGVVNIVTGDGATGAALVNHTLVDKVTFTGSTEIGKLIGSNAMKKATDVSLEMGGKSPAIVFDDADLDDAAIGVAKGIFRNMGQICVSGSRLYVQRKSFDRVMNSIVQEGKKMKISHGFDPDAQLGPLVSKTHFDSVCSYVEKGQSEGAELLWGGQKPFDKGYFLEPSVFTAVNNDQIIIAEEIFGPVLVGIPFDEVEEVIEMANDSKYGLSSAVFTKDISKAMRLIHELEAGWVWVNSPARSDPNFPLGGYKESGIGKELGRPGMETYLKEKAVNIVF